MGRNTIYHTPKIRLLIKIFLISLLVIYSCGILIGLILASNSLPGDPTITDLIRVIWQSESSSIIQALPVFVILALVLSFFIWINIVRIDEKGITVYNSLSRGNVVDWGSIEQVKPVNLIGLKYLKIYSNDKRIVYFPIFLKNMSVVHTLINEFSGESGRLFVDFG